MSTTPPPDESPGGLAEHAPDEEVFFGEVAVDLGLVSRADVDAALTHQTTEPPEERRPIGLILLDHGIIGPGDLNRALRELRRRLRRRGTPTHLDLAPQDLAAIDRRWQHLTALIHTQATHIAELEAEVLALREANPCADGETAS